MKVRFWGVRGSIATPGKNTAEYGGNTTCIEVEDDEGQIFVLDAGTGIRELGMDLLKRKIKNIHLLITHTHWDHIQGFPFFVPAYIGGNQVHIFGPTHYEKTLRKIMDLQMDYAYFPISMQQLNAVIDYRDLKEETIQIGNTRIVTKYSNHPVTGLCYKIISNGKSVVFTGDTEPYYNVLQSSTNSQSTGNTQPVDNDDPGFFGGESDESMDEIVAERNLNHAEFCKVDLLIHDAQYTKDEFSKFLGWGHSNMEAVIQMGKAAGVRQLVLTHHDPGKSDQVLAGIETKLKLANPDLKLCFSKEGMELKL